MSYLPIRLYIVLIFFLSMLLPTEKINAEDLASLSLESGNTPSLDTYIENHQKLAEKFSESREYEKAKLQFNLILKYAEENNKLVTKSMAIYNLGVLNRKLGDYGEALELLQMIENVSSTDADLERYKREAQNQIGYTYQLLGDYDMAYKYQLKVLQSHEANNDSLGVGMTYYQIGSIFYYQKNFEQALSYYQQSLEITKQFESKKNENVFNALSAIGSSYENLGAHDKAITFNLQALKLAKETGYTAGIPYATLNCGSSYLEKKDFVKALSFLLEAERLMRAERDRWGEIGAYRSLAQLYIETGLPNKSLKYLTLALPIAKELDSKVRILEIYNYYAQAYKTLGDFESAHKYLNKYIELKQKVLNETTLKEMGNQKTRYEMQKKESEIVLLKQQNDILERDQEIGKLYHGMWIGAALFLLLLLSLSFSRYKVQKRSNDLLSEKNKEINLQKEQLEEANKVQANTNELLGDKNIQIELQNKQLESSNEDLKQFAYVASHDLKEPLRMISSYTSILKRRYDPLFDDDAHEFMGYIVDAVGRMENLLSDLLVYSRVSTQQKAFKEVALKDIVDIVMGTLKYSIEQKGAEVFVNAESMPKIKASHTQMIQLFQNLISNAIKFTKESDPQVHINCTKEKDYYLFSVKDNGIGIKEADKNKIFEMFKRLHTREEFEGTGIGLATCKKIVNRHGGDIWVDSKQGEGSTFFFKIPLLLALGEKQQNSLSNSISSADKFIKEMSN